MAAEIRPPTLVLLDLGGVLLHLRTLAKALERKRLAHLITDPEAALVSLRGDEIFDRFERGRATEEEFLELVRRTLAPLAAPGADAALASLPDESIREVYVETLGDPVDGMLEIVQTLRRRGVRVAGLSDTSPVHAAVLPNYAVVRELERVVTSCETGHRKPAAAAYLTALRILRARPEETLFIDDRPANVEGAQACGLRALRFEGVDALRRELGL